MSPTQITDLRRSLFQLLPEADVLTDLFYARLFQLEPDLRTLFPLNLYAQKSKLLRALAQLAQNLDCPDKWHPQLEQMGKRHRAYGVHAEHYETFGAALIWTVEAGLGEGFTPALREAWHAFYDELAGVMQAREN